MLANPDTRRTIAKNIVSQMVRDLHGGKEIYLANVTKDGKISYTTDGRIRGQSKVNLMKELGKRFRSKKARDKWINNNWNRINASVWTKDKGALALNVRGISSNEYAQIVMWHRTLASKTGFMLTHQNMNLHTILSMLCLILREVLVKIGLILDQVVNLLLTKEKMLYLLQL